MLPAPVSEKSQRQAGGAVPQGLLPAGPSRTPPSPSQATSPSPCPARGSRGALPPRPGLSAHWHTSDGWSGVPSVPMCPRSRLYPPRLLSSAACANGARRPDLKCVAAARAGGEEWGIKHMFQPTHPLPMPLPPTPQSWVTWAGGFKGVVLRFGHWNLAAQARSQPTPML